MVVDIRKDEVRIMTDLEKIEKLCTTANVSAEDAKSALDACDGDILDAMIYLEKIGKVSIVTVGYFASLAI